MTLRLLILPYKVISRLYITICRYVVQSQGHFLPSSSEQGVIKMCLRNFHSPCTSIFAIRCISVSPREIQRFIYCINKLIISNYHIKKHSSQYNSSQYNSSQYNDAKIWKFKFEAQSCTEKSCTVKPRFTAPQFNANPDLPHHDLP